MYEVELPLSPGTLQEDIRYCRNRLNLAAPVEMTIHGRLGELIDALRHAKFIPAISLAAAQEAYNGARMRGLSPNTAARAALNITQRGPLHAGDQEAVERLIKSSEQEITIEEAREATRIARESETAAERDADPVNHPAHYTFYKGVEIIDLTEQMNFNRGNAVKYISRAGLKNRDTEIQDLEKAGWYINREIERLKNA